MTDTAEKTGRLTQQVAQVGCRVSSMAEGLVGSEILKIAADIRAMLAEGKQICNLTVGDFSPAEFRIPRFLEDALVDALRAGETNYPPSTGVLELRKAVQALYQRFLGLEYPLESILIISGSRPGIFGTYHTLVDRGDRVVFPVPSWNNNHYTHLVGGEAVPVTTRAEDAFMPTREVLEDAVRGARLLSLNSPLNPAGTLFTEEQLAGICDLVLEENARRGPGERPLYVLYDQVYGMLTFGSARHVTPVLLRPEMRDYTVFVDGISKNFAATGVRVGWTVAPPDVSAKLGGFLSHVGAWAPRAEQIATARLLSAPDEVTKFVDTLKGGVQQRLDALYDGFAQMRDDGLPVDVIAPMGAIYLSVRFTLAGRRTPAGKTLTTNEEIRHYLLEETGFAVVPFQAFGVQEDNGWFRLSVGAVSPQTIAETLPRVRAAVEALTG